MFLTSFFHKFAFSQNWFCPYFYQAYDFARLPNVAKVLEGDEDEGDVEGEEGEEVDQVHRLDEELGFHRTA